MELVLPYKVAATRVAVLGVLETIVDPGPLYTAAEFGVRELIVLQGPFYTAAAVLEIPDHTETRRSLSVAAATKHLDHTVPRTTLYMTAAVLELPGHTVPRTPLYKAAVLEHLDQRVALKALCRPAVLEADDLAAWKDIVWAVTALEVVGTLFAGDLRMPVSSVSWPAHLGN